MATQALRFWRRHRWTAVRSLLLVALLHRLNWLAFLAASSPVWLLTAFLLGVVLVHSEPNVPLAAEDEDRHLYKKIRHLTGGSSSNVISDSDPDNVESSSSGSGDASSTGEEHLIVGEKEEEVVTAAVAWTAEDEHSIQSIGSLELERDARLEKLMSRRSIHRNLIDLDVHIPAVLAPRKKSPLDLHQHYSYQDDDGDLPGSAPSSLLWQRQRSNPFDDIQIGDPDEEESERNAAMLRRHESFTAGAARPSRFRPYFVTGDKAAAVLDVAESNSNSNSRKGSSSSSSPPPSSSSSAGSDHQQGAAKAATAEEINGNGGGMVVAVDVELISDSSDDMSLPGDDAAVSLTTPKEQSEEEESFEVESITQQVAAGKQQQQQGEAAWVALTTLASVEENEKRQREVSEIREHHIFGPGLVPAPAVDSSTSARAGAGAAGAVVAGAGAGAAASASGATAKSSSKSKAASKKVAVFGFFRK